jgi:LysM repeat protein
MRPFFPAVIAETMRFSRVAAAFVLLAAILLMSSSTAAPAISAAPAAPPSEQDPAQVRLAELFLASDGTPKTPTSPRFAALREPALRGTRVLVGWLLQGIDANQVNALTQLTTALARQSDGALPPALAPFGSQLTLEVSIETVRDVPLLCVQVALPRAGASKDLELAVLRAASELAGDESSSLAGLARRLVPVARAVVEVHPPRPAPVAVRVTKPVRHVIERGDTLSEIAESHGLDLDALVQLTGVDPDRPIRPGDALKLSAGGPPRPKLYVAKSGDSLAKVARQFGVSEQALREVNRLALPRLSPGQKLVLPR